MSSNLFHHQQLNWCCNIFFWCNRDGIVHILILQVVTSLLFLVIYKVLFISDYFEVMNLYLQDKTGSHPLYDRTEIKVPLSGISFHRSAVFQELTAASSSPAPFSSGRVCEFLPKYCGIIIDCMSCKVRPPLSKIKNQKEGNIGFLIIFLMLSNKAKRHYHCHLSSL